MVKLNELVNKTKDVLAEEYRTENDKDAYTKTDVKRVIDALRQVIEQTLTSGEDIGFTGVGTFKVIEVPAKSGVSRITGEKVEWEKPAHKTVRVKVATALRSF